MTNTPLKSRIEQQFYRFFDYRDIGDPELERHHRHFTKENILSLCQKLLEERDEEWREKMATLLNEVTEQKIALITNKS